MFRGIQRLVRYWLVVPILRGNMNPVYNARGVLVGLVCAMTPLLGVQMALVGGVWAVQRLVAPEWRFNVVIAIAWTWVTNVFTVPFVYYMFVLTGQLMLGRWDNSLGFAAFSVRLEEILAIDGHNLTAIWYITVAIMDHWGLPLFLGSLPWMAAGGWIGYQLTLRFIRRRRRRRPSEQTGG